MITNQFGRTAWAIFIFSNLSVMAVDIAIENSSFEEPRVKSLFGYDTYWAPAAIRGWNVVSGSVDIVDSWVASDGVQSVDLSGFSAGTIEHSGRSALLFFLGLSALAFYSRGGLAAA